MNECVSECGTSLCRLSIYQSGGLDTSAGGLRETCLKEMLQRNLPGTDEWMDNQDEWMDEWMDN